MYYTSQDLYVVLPFSRETTSQEVLDYVQPLYSQLHQVDILKDEAGNPKVLIPMGYDVHINEVQLSSLTTRIVFDTLHHRAAAMGDGDIVSFPTEVGYEIVRLAPLPENVLGS